ncbi:MAG: hypothetical protein K0S09_170 [Sphingobacteriaceae bacterium]|jgi:ergothioneine biosynthesis protein EgtB|nr:hypothetical protein [Sphingobacteriaceae bacterium]
MLLDKYRTTRKRSEDICAPLETEDYVVQPVADVSPPKWHLGHTSWFFETFVLKPHVEGYCEFNPDYNYLYNSYYESVGARVVRTNRGNISRPGVEEIYSYRKYVDAAMEAFLASEHPKLPELNSLIILGLNHEEQHQELLLTDIKYILGHNPLLPVYKNKPAEDIPAQSSDFTSIPEGIYEIGYKGTDFCFDNELGVHRVYLHSYDICNSLVSNADYLEFMNAGGYRDFKFWHSEGWDWVNSNHVDCPMYWHNIDDEWFNYTFNGLQPLNTDQPVAHISYYEAWAYANWKGMRLPTEFEWEIASEQFNWGTRWEWTESAYLPYPGFKKAEGAIGEYNGKFMVSQMVLRGASEATSPGHSRNTYRNFFHPSSRWQFTGIRLAK